MALIDEGYETSEKGVSSDRDGDAVLDVSETNAGTVARVSLALSCAHNVPFESTRTEDSLSKWGPIGPSSRRTVIALSRPGHRSHVVEPNEMARRGSSKSRLSKGCAADPSMKRSASIPTGGECSPNSSDRSHLFVRPSVGVSITANLRVQILSEATNSTTTHLETRIRSRNLKILMCAMNVPVPSRVSMTSTTSLSFRGASNIVSLGERGESPGIYRNKRWRSVLSDAVVHARRTAVKVDELSG